MAASSTSIEEFLAGPLLGSCVRKPETLQVFDSFFDGAPVAEVLLLIDPEPAQPVPSLSNLQGVHITYARIKIFHSIIRNIKNIYEEELGQLVVSLPDCVCLGRYPGSEAALEQFKILILLLMGCAVQGPTKEHFIDKIKELPLVAQHDIVECIKQVTEDQTLVLTLDFTEQPQQRLYSHVRKLTSERDKLLQQWMTDLGQEVALPHSTEVAESNRLAVELADFKARLRKLRQELEEKNEFLTECREELEHSNAMVSKLKQENGDLMVEARKAKRYQDEMDVMRERVERADRLEIEVQRYRERLVDTEFYRVRVDELREDNRVLLETRDILEGQLVQARQRADLVRGLEAQLFGGKQKLNEIILERDAAKERVQELLEENFQLQNVTKAVLQESSSEGESEQELNSGDNSLSEQLTNNAQARALRLELENKKLLSTIDSLKEQSFHENSLKLLDLEKDKKKLLLKSEQLEESCERLQVQNEELENLFKNAIQENRKIQDSIETIKATNERQAQDLQNARAKTTELEKNMEGLSKEKQRIHILCDSIKKRADTAEKSLDQITEELERAKSELDASQSVLDDNKSLTEKVSSLEKDHNNHLKEIVKLKEVLEEKDVSLDQFTASLERREKDLTNLCLELKGTKSQIEKLTEFEQKSQELTSQIEVLDGTLTTLQNDLITEKLLNERIRNNLEKIGLNVEILDGEASSIFEVIHSKLPGTEIKTVESDPGEFLLIESLQAENAKLQVEIATLKSQINSLQMQQTAFQLANSQLVAEKDELSKAKLKINAQYDSLLTDQLTLRSIHEQLNSDFEKVDIEQEILKKCNRDLRSELRNLKEENGVQREKITGLEQEKEGLRSDAKNLVVLRAEHSKLKDDFRNLFTASDSLKMEYRNVQEELRKLRSESRSLRLGQTEMQGELNSTSDLAGGLQLDNAKLQQKCDMLFEMNHSLDADRRALMEHVSQLLSQYHSLLTHSLEDKQHYHLEEKLYTDKLNNLCRQKEKLEEKIMEHYRKLDNASSKKKSFGATLVKKVRKAGSDIINKVPSRNRRSWHEDSARLTQSQFTLTGSGDSEGAESDGSTRGSFKPRDDEVVLRKTPRTTTPPQNAEENMSLGSVGSRRTVYLSEDEPQAPPPPYLVYNRISTVIGSEVKETTTTNAVVPKESVPQVEKSKETAVWYEYGCV